MKLKVQTLLPERHSSSLSHVEDGVGFTVPLCVPSSGGASAEVQKGRLAQAALQAEEEGRGGLLPHGSVV